MSHILRRERKRALRAKRRYVSPYTVTVGFIPGFSLGFGVGIVYCVMLSGWMQ